MPAIFLAHGSPFLLDDARWVERLGDWARAMPRPSSILMISAHWVEGASGARRPDGPATRGSGAHSLAAPVTLAATQTVPLVYDFYGFPERYYRVTYPAPGAPELATRVRALLSPHQPIAEAPERGLDHGAYVPLIAMYPKADVPVLQISIPTMDPKTLVELGRALAPLRDEGVLVVGSGFLTHNMRSIDFEGTSAPPAWAKEFDGWCAEVLGQRDVDALVNYRERAPGVRMALPTHEHFVPVLTTMGASIDTSEGASFPITGFTYGSFTQRSLQLG
jgi:4,5-DOPA dioxygenase extradiol